VVGTVTYTFTPNTGQCATVTTLDVTIDAPSIVPTFAPIANICQGNVAPALPTTSTNSIAGSWNPSTIDTTVAGTVTYTFTPSTGQCATSTTLNVTIDSPNIVPTFNGIGSICLNSAAPALPTTSTNSITGSWLPSTIDTSVVGSVIYTFTPDALQCAVSTTLTVTIDAPITPLFTQLGPYCQGATVQVLIPTTSTNGVVGSWSPNTIDASVAGTFIYTFTPDAGYCATQLNMTIVINATPDVLPINDVDVCDSYTLPALTVGNYFSSPNGVNPITNLTLTASQTVYVYAQTAGTTCSDEASFEVTISDSPEFTVEGDCIGPVFTLTVVPSSGAFPNNVEYSWSNGTNVVGTDATLAVVSMGDYTCTVTFPGDVVDCDSSVTFTANDIFCIIPKGISPNGDGMNDFFNLSGFNVTQLNIYNRYGTIAYSKAGYVNEWGGQSNQGEELPDGTYFYVIERADAESKTGWVYINRNAN
jgi:gliding motility-associated-like protein